MKTFERSGELIPFTAPAGGVVSGRAYKIGSIVVVAAEDAAEAATVQGAVTEVYDLPKPYHQPWTELVKLYWDNTAKRFTTTSSGNTLVGVAAAAVPAPGLFIESDAAEAYLTIDNDTGVITIVDYAGLAGATVTVYVNGVPTVLTEGSGEDFLAETSNTVTATNLAAAIDALSDVGADSGTETVTVTLDAEPVIVGTPSSTGPVRLDGAAR